MAQASNSDSHDEVEPDADSGMVSGDEQLVESSQPTGLVRPERPQSKQGPGSKPSVVSSLIAIGLTAGTAVGLLVMLALLTLGYAAVIASIAAVVLLFVSMHYLVWGWWLGGHLHREAELEALELAEREQQQARLRQRQADESNAGDQQDDEQEPL